MNGASFFTKKGKRACLLIHGLTSTAQEFEEMARFLSKKNFTVIAPLLKGHNTSVQELNSTSWHDWFNSVLDSYNKIKKRKKIFVIGLSIGAILALHLAKQKRVSALVLLAPAIFYKDWRVNLSPLLKCFIKSKAKNYKKYFPWRKVSYFDIYSDKAIKERIAYTHIGLNALSSALSLITNVKKEIGKIECPALIIHSKKDHTIFPSSSNYIYNNLRSKNKRLEWLENSGHVITVDNEKEKVFQLVYDFMNEN